MDKTTGAARSKNDIGPIAQLGARLNGIEKVEGSNPSGSTFYLKHIEKVSPYQGAAHGSNPPGSTFYFRHIEKVGPLQRAAHGFESPWVHFLF